MKWFEGSIPGAIQAAKANSSVFIVYISGDDDMSRQMEEVWNDTAVCDLCEKERCIGLALTSTSAECKQFGEIYPVVCVPCTFFISNNGVPLEVVGGHLETRDFYRKIQGALQMHKGLLSSETPAGGASEVPAAPTSTSVTTPTGAQPTPAIPEPEVTQSQPQPAEPVTTVPSPAQPAEPAQPTQPTQPAEPEQPAQASGSQPDQPTKEDRVQRAREVIEEKRRLKAQKEKEEEKEKERQRRELGANLHQLKRMQADAEAEEIKQSRLKEKREEKEARERVRKQIAADKADRIARSQKEKDERQNIAAQASTSSPSTAPPPVVDKSRMETARLQFRLPDGRAFTNQFPSSEPLSVTRDYVASMASSLGPFRLSTTYPKRIFTPEDMSQTLLDLNLAPSAVLVVLPGGSGTAAVANTESVLSFKFLTMVLSYPFIQLWSFVTSFFTPPPLHTHRRPTPLAGPTPAARPSSSSSQPAPDSQKSSSSRGRPKSSYGVRRRQEGNIHRLSADDSDDEQNTWNGNSTQQM